MCSSQSRYSGPMLVLVCSVSPQGHWAPRVTSRPLLSILIHHDYLAGRHLVLAETFLHICVGLSFPQYRPFCFLTFIAALIFYLVVCACVLMWWCMSVRSVSLPDREKPLRSHLLGPKVPSSAF